MRRARNIAWPLILLSSLLAIACTTATASPTPSPTFTPEPQFTVTPTEPECPPEFPHRNIEERYSVQYSSDVHRIFTPIVRGALGNATVTCHLDLQSNRGAAILIRYRFTELLSEESPALLMAALIAAGIPESEVEMTPLSKPGIICSGAVHAMDLRYLGISGETDARFLLIGTDIILEVAALRSPCALHPEEWTLIVPEDGSPAMQVDSTFGFAIAEALGADMKLGCVTSGGLGESSSLELRYTLDHISISDAAAEIGELIRGAGGTLDSASPRKTKSAASAYFSNARFGNWTISGELVYADEPTRDQAIVRAALIAEPK